MTMTEVAPPAMRDMAGAWFAFMGIDKQDPGTYQSALSFAKAPADEAWVYSCIRYLYTSAMGVPLHVYVRDGGSLVKADEAGDGAASDMQYLLDYVNPVDMTGSDLKAWTVASLSVWGENFWSKVRGRLGGPPQELYWLRAADVDVQSQDGRAVDQYVYQPQGLPPKAYKPRDIVPFKMVNLANPLRGLSPLSSITSDISTGRWLSQKAAARIANDSIPPGYWQVPRDAEFSKQDENLVRRTLRMLRGPRNTGKVPVMPLGLEFKGISLSPQAAEAIASGKVSRMAICAALGVPLVLAGDDDKNTVYGNLRDAERIFWRRFLSTLDSYADSVNNWLTPDFDPTRRRLKVAFDYSDIEALRPTLDTEWNMWIAGIYSQAVVANEFRRKFKIGKDVPWGNDPTPRTAASIKVADPNALPGEDLPAGARQPAQGAPSAPPPAVAHEPVLQSPEPVAATLRAYGRGLYQHPAVRAHLAGATLDARTLVGDAPEDDLLIIADGLRRRQSADQIATRLEVKA